MNVLFLHRDFPGQFKYLAWALTTIPDCKVVFITEDKNVQMAGVEKLIYTVPDEVGKSDSALDRYDTVLKHAQAAAKIAKDLKAKGFKPDIIFGFNPWGVHLFMKDIFPDTPLISYCEWFYNFEGADIGFDARTYSDEMRGELRCKNAHMLVDLYSCDACLSPTQWQKMQFPKEFQNKIRVIHDGVDTEFFKPDESAKFLIKDKGL